MTGKIFRNFVAVSTSVFLVCIGLFMFVLYGSFSANLSEELEQQTALIADGVALMGPSYLEQLDLPKRVTWVGPEGEVLFDNRAEPGAMENHRDREEIREALESGKGESVRYSGTLSFRTVYRALRLEDGTVIRVAESQSTAAAMLGKLLPPMLVILAAAGLLSMALAFRLSRRLVIPILDLDLEHPENCRTYDELAPLLTRLRRQNETIQSQMDELRRQQEEFKELTDHMSEGILALDKKGRILSCNTAALLLLGMSGQRREIDRGSGPYGRAVERALQGGRGHELVEQGGRWVQIIANPVLRAGVLTGVVMVLLDVTERENSERVRREFTANVSHELKTPLTSISGMAEIIHSGIVRPEDVPEFAGDILRESRRLIALVEDIIHLSQLDEGGALPQKQPVEILDLAGQVARRLKRPAEMGSITFRVEGEEFTAYGIPNILEEIVYNLCDNAVKYNRPGGRVTLTTDRTERTLTVTDTGIGIPQEDQQRVFERFYRVDKSRSRQIGGTGLGLSIVKHGAALHDITVELSSIPDRGTSVKLYFPPEEG